MCQVVLHTLGRKIQLFDQNCVAERELQLPVFAPSEGIWTWILTSYNILLAFGGQRLGKLQKAAQRRYSVNICRMKIHTLASHLPSCLLSFIHASLLARHHEKYKERRDGLSILYSSDKTNSTPSPNTGDWEINVLWVSIMTCTEKGPWQFLGKYLS